MCWSDECLLARDVDRPAWSERKSVSTEEKKPIAFYDQRRPEEAGSMQFSAPCLFFFSVRICIFIDLLAYFVFMRFVIKFHHASCVIFYSEKGRRKLRLDRWSLKPILNHWEFFLFVSKVQRTIQMWHSHLFAWIILYDFNLQRRAPISVCSHPMSWRVSSIIPAVSHYPTSHINSRIYNSATVTGKKLTVSLTRFAT